MLKKNLARISLLVVVILGATVVAMALSTGISEAQGPDDGQGGAGRGAYGYGDGSQIVQPVVGTNLPAATTDALSEAAVEALMAAIQDEYRAYAVYQAVIDQFGPVNPFTRIQAAEAQHIAALEVLFDRYGIAIPDAQPLEDLPEFASVADACALGAAAEVANFDLYDNWLAQTSEYPDLVEVFTSLRSVSEFKHLPAFERCAG